MPESTAPVATTGRPEPLPATVMAPPPLRGWRAPGSRLARATAVVAFIGVLVALAGLGLGLRPLATPTQDCGTAATFLLRGGVDEFVDPADPPPGVTRAEAEANAHEPCQERAGNRALPAGLMLVGGTVVALVALLVESAARYRTHRADRRTATTPPQPTEPVG